MKIKVAYEPKKVGQEPEEVTYRVKPRHLVRFEDEVGEFTETAKSGYMLAWMASDTEKDFKSWLDGVDDIVTITDKGDTPPAVEGDSAEGEGEAEAVPTE